MAKPAKQRLAGLLSLGNEVERKRVREEREEELKTPHGWAHQTVVGSCAAFARSCASMLTEYGNIVRTRKSFLNAK